MHKDHAQLSSDKFLSNILEQIKEIVLKLDSKKLNNFNVFIKKITNELLKTHKIFYLKNVLHFIFSEKEDNIKNLKATIIRNCNITQFLLKQNKEKIIENIANKIKNGGVILTHGTTFCLIDAFKKAKQEGKNFSVIITDSPFSEIGKKYLSELRKIMVHPVFYPAAGLKSAIKKSDFFIFNAEAVSPTEILGELGTDLISESSLKQGIPVYAVSTFFNFYKEIDIVDFKEIWPQKLKGSHSFLEDKFDRVNPSFVSGIISEKGTHSHAVFTEMTFKKQKMF